MEKSSIKMNMATTLDGHIILPNNQWNLGSNEDKRRMDNLRKWANCIIVSRKSVEQDNPNLYIRQKPVSRYHPIPILIMHDIQKILSHQWNLFYKPHPIGRVFIHKQKSSANKIIKIEQLFSNNELQKVVNNKKNNILKWGIDYFHSFIELKEKLLQLGFSKILLEGGGKLNGFFLKENLIDEICCTLVPYLFGGNSHDRIFITAEYLPLQKLKLISQERRKDEIFLRYRKKNSI